MGMKDVGQAINEAARTTRVVADVDVCVVGGSCAGVFAAVRASEAGMRVAIIERSSCFGGSAAYGTTVLRYRGADGGGLMPALVEHLLEMGEAILLDADSGAAHAFLNPTGVALALDGMVVVNPQILPFLNAVFVGVAESGPCHPTHAIIEDGDGRKAIAAKFFIDATGDASFVARAGFETWNMPDGRGSLRAVLSGVDEVSEKNTGFSFAEMARADGGEVPSGMTATPLPLVAARQLVSVAFGGITHGAEEAGARREIEARLAVAGLVRRANVKFPAEDSEIRIASFADGMTPGHARHARCEAAVLTVDLKSGRVFEDAVAAGTIGGVDYQFPFGAMVPRGARNVLCAGRAMDCDAGASGAVSAVANSSQCGEAAGVAAARCVAKGVEMADAWRGIMNEKPSIYRFVEP